MSQETSNQSSYQTLPELLRDMWQARSFMMAGLMAAALFCVAVQLSTVQKYETRMIIAPAGNLNSANAGASLGEDDFFALRYMMQRVGIGGATDFVRFETTYSGPSVARALLKDPDILSGLQRDADFKGIALENYWSAGTLANYIEKNVTIDPVGATPYRTLRYKHPNKAFGQYFLHHLHKTTDEIIRNQIRTQSAQRIDYLAKTVRQTKNPEHKRALTSLLMEQERLNMLVSIGLPYAAAVIEPPASSVKPVWPPKTLLWVVSALIGMFLGYVAYTVKTILSVEYSVESGVKKNAKTWYKPTARNMNHGSASIRKPLTQPQKQAEPPANTQDDQKSAVKV